MLVKTKSVTALLLLAVTSRIFNLMSGELANNIFK